MIEDPSRQIDSSKYHTRLWRILWKEVKTRSVSTRWLGKYHSLHRSPRVCTMKRETAVRWQRRWRQRRRRAKGRKRFPASTTDTALAPRHTDRSIAQTRRRLDSAHAHASQPAPVSKLSQQDTEFTKLSEAHYIPVTMFPTCFCHFYQTPLCCQASSLRHHRLRGFNVPAVD